jgi:hypothetical protein
MGNLLLNPSKWKAALFEPVSAAPLGLFRIFWGGIMFYYFFVLAIGGGKYKYLDTIFRFKYPFFDWVVVASPTLMNTCFYGGVVLSIMMSLGAYYKFTSRVLLFLYTYTFLLDMSYWNNHYYAYMLIGCFFALSDGHKAYSIDKMRFNLEGTIPYWQLFLFQFQFILVYFYGGLSKLQNKDWMTNSAAYSMLHHNLKLDHSLTLLFSLIMTYGGIIYDFFIGFFLSRRQTLWWCLPFILLFNISNFFLFNIGSFPFAMMASFVLFIPSGWLATQIAKWTKQPNRYSSQIDLKQPIFIQKIGYVALMSYVAFQLIFPLRSLFYEGSVFWTAEGKLCAWHMMAGSSYVKVNNFNIIEYNDQKTVRLSVNPIKVDSFLSKKQIRTLGTFPFAVPQFAKFLKKEAELAGFKNVAIKGEVYISKNYRPMTLVIDPDIDLSALDPKHFGHNDWLLRYQIEDGFFAE